jgi:RHS repeat-associated protein
VIGSLSQTLGEEISLTGTPFGLHYRSDRTPGRKAAYTLRIPLSGANVPPSLLWISLSVRVAGQQFTKIFPPEPNQSFTFTWDGKDAYGRTVQGQQKVAVGFGWAYGPKYMSTDRFGYRPADLDISGTPARDELTFWQRSEGLLIGGWDARASGLGGWSLGVHHGYDPVGRVLHLGDGTRRSAESMSSVINTVAGGGPFGSPLDGIPATQTSLPAVDGFAMGPDGSLYISLTAGPRVYKVGPDGIINRFAGTNSGYSGDGGPATKAQLNGPLGLAVGPDGSVYIADTFNNVIRKVSPNGIIDTVAGNGAYGYGGNGGPAKDAQLTRPTGVAVGPDGTLYIADRGHPVDGGNRRVRMVGTDGIITTIAGNGNPWSSGDGGPATQAGMDPLHVAVGPDGSVYITDHFNNNLVRRVGQDGIITRVAGGRNPPDRLGDGGPATEAALHSPWGTTVGPDGSLYIVDAAVNRVRRVTPDGIINTVAGNGDRAYNGNGRPAKDTALLEPRNVAVRPDGGLYFSDSGNRRVRSVDPPLPSFGLDDLVIPSEDGSEVYVFSFKDTNGRHFRTLDALTGAVRYEFGYDGAGRLETVTDGDRNVTRVERDASGSPTAIVAPFGQQTKLEVNTDGYLERITNPAGEAVQLTYYPSGLLHTLTDPRGIADPQNHTYTFEYDELGRLKLDKDPAEGFSALARTRTSSGYKVALLTAEGRESSYQVERLPTGDEQRVNKCCGGTTEARVHTGRDGTETVTMPDGTETKVVRGPDPRWGMQSPIPQTINVTTPGQRKLAISTDRKVTLTDPSDLFSVSSITDTTTVNGQLFTRTYQMLTGTTTRTITDGSPEGRRAVRTLDPRGRVVKTQVGDLLPVNYSYDDKGRLKTITQGTGPEARSFAFTYDGDGYIETITDPLGQTTSFSYDNAGRVKTLTRPDGKVIGYSYDAYGNLGSLTPPGRPSHSFPDYTPVNLRSRYDPPDVEGIPDETCYYYNHDRRPREITGPDGKTVVPVYDPPSGQLDTLTLPTGQVVYTYYTNSGNLKSITTPDGIVLSYSYDGSLLTSETWSGTIAGTVSHTYDNNLRVFSQSINDAHRIEYPSDNDGLLSGAGKLVLHRDPAKGLQAGLLTNTTLGGLTDVRDYNNFGDIKSYSAAYAGTVIYAVEYTLRDKMGRIKAKTETLDGQTHAYVYTYDKASRLEDVMKNGTRIAHYEYDDNGNRLSYTAEDGTIVDGSYDGQDRLEQYGDAIYTYTARGELESKTTANQTTAYEYDVLGNLKVVDLPDGKHIEYVVDGLNRRIGKKVDGTQVQGFLYEGELNPVAELDGSGNVVSRFIYATKGNVPDYMEKGGTTYRLVSDHLGSVRLVVDATTGEVAQRIDYDEFGQILRENNSNPDFQPFAFAGGLYDPDTQLVHFGAREYDAETGRWTTKDPSLFEGLDTNLYQYVLGDPINSVDPAGKQSGPASPGPPISNDPWAGWRVIFEMLRRLLGEPPTGWIQKPPEPPVQIERPAPPTPAGPGPKPPGPGGLDPCIILFIPYLVDPCENPVFQHPCYLERHPEAGMT